MLVQVVENTDLLITGLKNLNSNIKHYIDDLTGHSTVAQIIERLEAKELTYHYLHEVIEAFRNMDEILLSINEELNEKQMDMSGIYEIEFMDVDTFRKFKKFSKPLTESDRKNITKMLEDKPAVIYAEVLREMLRSGKKLEQECIFKMSH